MSYFGRFLLLIIACFNFFIQNKQLLDHFYVSGRLGQKTSLFLYGGFTLHHGWSRGERQSPWPAESSHNIPLHHNEGGRVYSTQRCIYIYIYIHPISTSEHLFIYIYDLFILFFVFFCFSPEQYRGLMVGRERTRRTTKDWNEEHMIS